MILLRNTTIHTIVQSNQKMIKDDPFAEYNEESNEKDPKFKIGDRVRISNFKNIFAKGYLIGVKRSLL